MVLDNIGYANRTVICRLKMKTRIQYMIASAFGEILDVDVPEILLNLGTLFLHLIPHFPLQNNELLPEEKEIYLN